MTDVVFSAKMLETMHFLSKHLFDTTFSFDVPAVTSDGDQIKSLDQLATEMNVSTKVAAAFALEAKNAPEELTNQARQVLHPGILSKSDNSVQNVVNYAYKTAKISDSTELKAVRMVRTVFGARRFGQPRGSIIVRDGAAPLDGLVALNNDVPGYDKLADRQGRVFYLGNENGSWVVRNPLNNSILHSSNSQESSLSWLNHAVGGTTVPKKKDKNKEPRRSGATGTRPTGDESRDEVMNELTSDKNDYQLASGEKSSLYKLTTAQLAAYKSARDKGLDHAKALAAAQKISAPAPTPKKAAS